MKIAHLADLHSNLRSRQAEAHRVLSWIVDDLREKKPDLILDAGDVYDVLPASEEEDWTARFYRSLADIAPVVGVTGNHAMGARPIPRLLLPADQAEPQTRHPILVLERPGVVHVAGAAIACLPWPKRGQLMAATGGMGVEQRRVGGVAAIGDVLGGLGAELAAHDGPRILLAHAMVRSSRVGHGQPLDVGHEFELGLEGLALAGADYVALGHIHLFQAWSWGRSGGGETPMVFAGSAFATDFGDVDGKGYVTADFDQDVCGCAHAYRRGSCGACDNRGRVDWERAFTPATPMVLLEDSFGVDGWKPGATRADGAASNVAGAEVRLRYKANGDQRDAAGRAAEQERDRLLAAGATRVVIEAEIAPTVRARAPEIASQSALSAQWETWAKSTGVAEERHQPCKVLVEELESDAENDTGGPRSDVRAPDGGAVGRLHSFRVHNVGPFDDAELDLDALAGPLVALVGPNGAGKSTLLSFGFPGAMYRDGGESGTIAERARGRDSFIDSHVGDYLLRHHVDAHTGKGESLVSKGGTVLLESGSVRDFDRWAGVHLPPRDLFFASVFGAQGSRGVAGMLGSERKRVILRALGTERVEARAEQARKREDVAQQAAATIATRLADERQRSTPIDVAQGAVDTAAAALRSAQDVVNQERAALAVAREQNATRGAAEDRAQAHAGRLAELTRERAEHEGQRAGAERRRTVERAKLVTAARTREDAALVDERRAACAGLAAAIQAADDHAERELELAGNVTTTDDRVHTLEAKRAGLAPIVADAAAIRATAAQVETLRAQLAAAEMAAREAQARASEGLRVAHEADSAAASEGDKGRVARRRAVAAEQRLAALAGAEDAAARLPGLRAELAAAEEAERTATADAFAAGRDAREADTAERAALTRADEAQGQARAAWRRAAVADGAEAAAARLPRLRAAADEARAAADAGAVELERLRTLLVGGQGTRIAGLRTGLQEAAAEGSQGDHEGAMVVADRALAADDRLAAEHAAAPEAVKAARAAHVAAILARDEAQKELAFAERLAERLPELHAAREDRRLALEAAATATAEAAQHRARLVECDAAVEGHRAAAGTHRAEVARLRPLVTEAETLVAGMADRAAAEVERRTAEETADAADAEAERLRARGVAARTESSEHSDAAAAHTNEATRLRPLFETAERTAARLPELAQAETSLAHVDEQLVPARDGAARAAAAFSALGPPPVRPAAEEVERANAALRASESAVLRLPELASADATIAGLEETIASATTAIGRFDQTITTLGPVPSVPPMVDLEAAEEAVGDAERDVRSATTAHARAEAALASAREGATRIVDLEQQLRAAEEHAADWSLVAKGLGKDGVQALLIDAAGPELTGLVNDLLRSCFGSQYTVTINTTRPKKSGGGDKEVCDILVYDALSKEREKERDVSRYSGGQRVILGEAIALALSLLSCRRAGLEGVTLVRDETAGQLDEEHGPAYITMLRRAAQIVKAAHVIFVSHTKALRDLADSRVSVRDGKVQVEGTGDAPSSGDVETTTAMAA